MEFILWFISIFRKKASPGTVITPCREQTAPSGEMHTFGENAATQTKYKAEPGKFLLVETYFGCEDRLFPVDTHEAGDNLTSERYHLYRRADAED